MNRKIKVVLLCHYWSDEMAEIVGRKHYFQELSPWIQETLNLFKNKDDVELHVVAPNYASNSNIVCDKDGIHFHYYHYSPSWLSKMAVPLILRFVKHKEPYKIAERLANTLTGFRKPAKIAVEIVHGINPDIVHLYGSENPDYAAPGLILLKEYPLLLTLQGYVCLQPREGNWLERRFYDYRIKYEQSINNTVKYVSYSKKVKLEEFKQNEVHYFGNVEKVYHIQAITKIPQIDATLVKKEYDLVFYARVDKNKGIEDLIEVIDRMKRIGRPLKSLIMGRGSEAYVQQLKQNIKERDLGDLIDFAGFIEHHEDVYKLASRARLMVLPTHNDGIPNTIREAMFMKLPVVANRVGGIPRFNQNRHCIHLVEVGDFKGMTEGICKMLDDDGYRNRLMDNAYKEAVEVYSPKAIYGQIIEAYKDVVNKLKKA